MYLLTLCEQNTNLKFKTKFKREGEDIDFFNIKGFTIQTKTSTAWVSCVNNYSLHLLLLSHCFDTPMKLHKLRCIYVRNIQLKLLYMFTAD